MNGVRTLEYFLMNQFRVLGGVKNAGFFAVFGPYNWRVLLFN
jgi:hypothetical protein